MMIWNPVLETMSRSEMEQLQLERLQATVERCYHRVPLFRQRCDAVQVKPEDIRSLTDLVRLPFLRKEDLREAYPWGLFAEPRERVVRVHASSGTRGKPTVVGYTAGDIDLWAEVMARCFCMAGGKPGDIVQNAYGYGLFTGGLGLHYGLEKAGAMVIPASGGNTVRQVLLVRDLQPQGIGCTPSYALNIADHMAEQGLAPRSASLRYAMLGAEPWSESMRQQIEQRLGLHAVDLYGLSEVIGPGVSCECREQKDGLHINEDHFLPEVVDPDTGEHLPDGTYGELVFTSLTKEAFPVVRYRTGDICSLNREPCPCGRTLVRMSRVKGRADDMLVVRGVNLFPSEIEYHLLRLSELAPHYQVVIDRDGALDSVEVQVEIAEAVAHEWDHFEPQRPEAVSLASRAATVLKNGLGVSCRVRLMPPKGVPRSEGKAVRLIDRRKL